MKIKYFVYVFVSLIIFLGSQNYSKAIVCPSGQTLCESGICATSCTSGSGTNTCPADKPARCLDGSCVVSDKKCPTENGCTVGSPVKCTIDGSCVEFEEKCPTQNGCTAGSPVKCSDGTCKNVETECGAISSCPPDHILCSTGECKLSKEDCSSLTCNPACEGNKVCKEGICVEHPQTACNPHCADGEVCKEGLCVKNSDGGSGGNTLNPLKKEVADAIKEINLAKISLRKNKAARPFIKKVSEVIRQLKSNLRNGGESCEEIIEDLLIDDLSLIVDDLNEIVCDDETVSDCVPEDLVDQFTGTINNAINVILELTSVDENENFFSDVCE